MGCRTGCGGIAATRGGCGDGVWGNGKWTRSLKGEGGGWEAAAVEGGLDVNAAVEELGGA